MSLLFSWLEHRDTLPNFTWAAIACLTGIITYALSRPKSPFDAIPAVTRTGFFSSYIDAIAVIKDAEGIIQKGYDKYNPGVFRIPKFDSWHVLVTGEKLIEEVRKAPDDILSAVEACKDILASDYTLGPGICADPYHVSALRGQFTRNLGETFAGMHEEMDLAFEKNIPVTEDWTSIRLNDAVMKIVSQTTNRLFVGAPTCRNTEYVDLSVQFTTDVVIGGKIIGLFPKSLKPFAGRYFTKAPRSIRKAFRLLKPVIEARQRTIEENGPNHPSRPVGSFAVPVPMTGIMDILSSLLDKAEGEERTTENLTRRIMFLNFAAVHTTSGVFTVALFELASRPEYIAPIREEAEAAVKECGWSKAALSHMRKLDSFLKETQRLQTHALAMHRKAMTDITISGGTRIPKGAFVSVPIWSRQRDEEVYPDAATFDGFRFSNMEVKKEEEAKNHMVSISADYLIFGYGRHACPGRFFAVTELKAMMAHVLMTYDIKMDRPAKMIRFSYWKAPDPTSEVMFRKRRQS